MIRHGPIDHQLGVVRRTVEPLRVHVAPSRGLEALGPSFLGEFTAAPAAVTRISDG